MTLLLGIALATVLLCGCSHPQTCQEQVTDRISSVYSDPVALGRALDVVCTGIQDPYPTAVP